MRRALSQALGAISGIGPTGGAGLLAQLAAPVAAMRCAGEASTSYGAAAESGGALLVLARSMSGKGGKGKGGSKGAAAAPAPPPPSTQPSNPALLSAGARLRRRRPPPDPLAALPPAQRDLALSLAGAAALPPAPAPAAPPGAPPAAGAPAPPGPAAEAGPVGLGRVGLPLDAADVGRLLSSALAAAADGGGPGSGAARGAQQAQHGVAFQPFVFSNIFQSAPAAASYVAAALESGSAWGRIERFFLAAVEGPGGAELVEGVRVQVNGRLGRKSDMAETKVWSWGETRTRPFSARLDYGAAAANTRMGVLGVKVWIRYRRSAIADVFFPRRGGSHHGADPAPAAAPRLRLDDLLAAAATALEPPRRQRQQQQQAPLLAGVGGLGGRFAAVGWWERPGPAQAAANRPWEAFAPGAGFAPGSSGGGSGGGGDRLSAYLQRAAAEARRFRSWGERAAYMATTGRFLAKQRRMAAAAAAPAPPAVSGAGAEGAIAGAGAPAGLPLGRRRGWRVLARFSLAPYVPRHRRGIVGPLRHRAAAGAGAGGSEGAGSARARAGAGRV